MQSYREIRSNDDMEALLDSVTAFHDSMLKEVHLSNRGFVDASGGMFMTHNLDMQLLIQSQIGPSAVELLFSGVTEFHVTDSREFWEASGRVHQAEDPVKQTDVEMCFDSGLKVRSARLFYRDRPECLGPRTFLGSEVPSPDAVGAQVVEENWRLCSACCDAWEEDPDQPFSYCSGCMSLTELRRDRPADGPPVPRKEPHQDP